MALFRYFKRKGNSEKLPINIDCIFNSEVRSTMGQYGKYTPEQKAIIGKRAAEHGVIANLCIPDHFVASYHFSMCARGVWFRPDSTTFFYHELSIHEIFTPLPPKIPEKGMSVRDEMTLYLVRILLFLYNVFPNSAHFVY